MRGPIPDKIRVQHILDAIAETEKYLTGVSFEDFLNNSEKRFATVKQIEIIGEASNYITDAIKKCILKLNGLRSRDSETFLFIILRGELSNSMGNCDQ